MQGNEYLILNQSLRIFLKYVDDGRYAILLDILETFRLIRKAYPEETDYSILFTYCVTKFGRPMGLLKYNFDEERIKNPHLENVQKAFGALIYSDRSVYEKDIVDPTDAFQFRAVVKKDIYSIKIF